MTAEDNVVHLEDLRPKPTGDADWGDWKTVASHLMSQNKDLTAKLDAQSGKMDQLCHRMEALVSQMDRLRHRMEALGSQFDEVEKYPGLGVLQMMQTLGGKSPRFARNMDYRDIILWKWTRMRFWCR